MSLFYRIDFAAEHHVRRGYLQWFVAAAFAGLIAGGVWFAWLRYEESRLPVLQPRLAQYQTLISRIEDVSTTWHQAENACREIREYVEREDQIPPEKVLPLFMDLKDTAKHASENGCPFAFLPVRLEFSRASGETRLTGAAPLPEREKAAHCVRLAETLSEAVTNGPSGRRAEVGKYAFVFKWKKGSPTAQDQSLEAELSLKFGLCKPVAFPPVPRELEAALHSAEAWRTAVHKCRVQLPHAAQPETVGTALSRVISENRQALGAEYDAVKAFADTAIDPMAVCEKIHHVLGGREAMGCAVFEEAWRDLSQRRWRRETALDNPNLDAEIATVEGLSMALPRNQLFDDTLEKCAVYRRTLSKGVRRQHIVEEETFCKDVLLPCVSDNGRLNAVLAAKIVPDEKAARVSFPVWRVTLGTASDKTAAQPKEGHLSSSDVERVLANVASNPVGLWVTSVVLEFDAGQSDVEQRWKALKSATIEGRVPCWMEKSQTDDASPVSAAKAKAL